MTEVPKNEQNKMDDFELAFKPPRLVVSQIKNLLRRVSP